VRTGDKLDVLCFSQMQAPQIDIKSCGCMSSYLFMVCAPEEFKCAQFVTFFFMADVLLALSASVEC